MGWRHDKFDNAEHSEAFSRILYLIFSRIKSNQK